MSRRPGRTGLQGQYPRRAAMPVTVHDLAAWKARGERFIMLTAYDALTARVLDEAGVPLLLVGDSLGNNVLGYDSTIPVTMEEALVFTAAVARGATSCWPTRSPSRRPAVSRSCSRPSPRSWARGSPRPWRSPPSASAPAPTATGRCW